jgi:peptidoglycan/LPS O-acetylase OafA/YrhL
MPRPSREFDIDTFRGVVCLSLVALHFYQNGPLQPELGALLGDAGVFALLHLRLGVESFFLLAGFMVAHTLRPVAGEVVSFAAYLKRRFYRLILPYWTAVLLAALDLWLVGLVFDSARGTRTSGEIVAQLTLLQELFGVGEAAVGYWSMVSLEQFYLLLLLTYAVCAWVFGRTEAGYGKAERALSHVVLAAALGSGAAMLLIPVPAFELVHYAIYLTTGMLLYWAVRQGKARVHLALAVALLVVLALVTGKSRPLAACVSVLLFIPLARGYRLPDWAAVRWLSFCGQRAYSIYLVHGIVGLRVLSLVRVMDRENPWAIAALCLVAAAASLVAAELFYRLVERPWQKRAQQVAYRAQRAPTPVPACVAVESARPSVL